MCSSKSSNHRIGQSRLQPLLSKLKQQFWNLKLNCALLWLCCITPLTFANSVHKPEDIQAFQILLTVAKTGSAQAERMIASLFEHGEGVDKDLSQAIYWYRKSADHHDDIAQFYLGYLYYQGRGVAKDAHTAFQWFLKAARQGNPDFQYNVANLYRYGDGIEKDFNSAFEWYARAARQDHVQAQNDLGQIYFDGIEIKKDLVLAYFWFKLALQEQKSSKKIPEINLLMTPEQSREARHKIDDWIKKNRVSD